MVRSLLFCAVATGALTPFAAAPAQGVYTSIYEFSKKTGTDPLGSLIEGANGVLYGTTSKKAAGYGSVYSLSPPVQGGSWTAQPLYKFLGGTDGATPEGALVSDASGVLYGTTSTGGAAKKWGTVFKLVPPGKGSKTWTETILYSFTGKSDGGTPRAGLSLGSDGTLYGTASVGGSQDGADGLGTVFSLAPPAKGQTAWIQTVLHTFQGPDGANPLAALTTDATGALYGTASVGGAYPPPCAGTGCGVVFQMVPPAKGKTNWTENVLYSFGGDADGLFPRSNVTFDQSGNIYGTVEFTNGYYGSVYELSPPSDGGTIWNKSTLYTVPQSQNSIFAAGVVFGKNGALYGVAAGGGTHDWGYVFQLTPPGGGQTSWTETDVYDFGVNGDEPYVPTTSLLLSTTGAFVGTSGLEGASRNGVAYQITP